MSHNALTLGFMITVACLITVILICLMINTVSQRENLNLRNSKYRLEQSYDDIKQLQNYKEAEYRQMQAKLKSLEVHDESNT